MADKTHHKKNIFTILQRLEENQKRIELGQKILAEQLEKLQEAGNASANQFRSHQKAFGGYGAKNIRNQLRARGHQISEASRRKADRYREAGKAEILPA